jgi:Carboxypeptidase regulatory-like domain
MKNFKTVLVGLSLLIFSTEAALGQNRNSGEIRGTVVDASGAPLPGVNILISNANTGISTSINTSASGTYDALTLEPGQYILTFSKDGCKRFLRSGVGLNVETITIDAKLEVGVLSQQISVQSSTPLIQTETSDRRTTLTSQSVTELPNVGRSWYDLTGQLAGVNPGSSGQQNASGEGVGVNGSPAYHSNWLVDGGVGMLPVSQNPDLLRVPLEAIAEADFETSNFGAEYGNGTSVFNIITKSGTNQFHGSLFEFVQNDVFEARNYFTPSVIPLRWNQFGGTVGGPIKRNKAFFFFSVERNPTNSYSYKYYTFPTNAMRGGDFSAPGLPTVYDPNSLRMAGGVETRSPFAGNQMPSSQIDPVAAKIQSYFPQPNLPGIANNYYFNSASPVTTTYYNGRVDYNLTAGNRLTGSVMIVPQSQVTPAPTCPMDCGSNAIRESLGQITDAWTISPNVVNEFRVSVIREFGTWTSPNVGEDFPEKLGLPNLTANAFPNITIGGTVASNITGGLTAGLGFTSYTTADTLTRIVGRHTFKFGGEFDKWQNNEAWATTDAGDFGFSGVFTRNPADKTSNGLGYADFLSGLPNSWGTNVPPAYGARVWNFQAFVQDDYKIRPNLTLNLGLRYMIQPGWTEVHNRIANFDPTLINPATGTLGAMWYAGQDGRKSLEKTVYDVFAPRIGFAWEPRNHWSVRGGYGIFQTMWGANSYTSGMGTGWATQGNLTSTDQLTPIFKLAQGPPSPVYPSAANRTASLLNGTSVSYTPYDTPVGYVEQWQFDVQHEMAGGILADVAYVGNRGVHLGFGRDINQVPTSLLGPGNTQLLRPYPQYQAINASLFDGISSYNSLQVSGRKRFGNGVYILANYTYAKSLDTGSGSGWGGYQSIDAWQNAYNIRANYGPSIFDMTHLFNGSVVYELPFGKGKKFLDEGGVVNAIAGGWQVSSTFQIHSGLPFTPTMGTANLSGALSGSWYPNRVGNGSLSNPTVQGWFDPSAFTSPAEYTFGNSGRNILRGPGFANWNASASKSFHVPLGEAGRLEIRADAYDVLNHANFGNPNASIGSAAVATITSSTTSRNLQLGAKLSF